MQVDDVRASSDQDHITSNTEAPASYKRFQKIF